jgi:serine/threonine protein phosphatase PrpC
LSAVSLAWFCDSLSSINLSSNALEAIPPELFQLRYLAALILFNNRISTIPPELSTSGLQILDLSENPLTQLPRIPLSLITLKVNFCGISDFSEIIPLSNSLRVFHAVGNGIETVPSLPAVEELFLGSNSITAIPALNTNVYAPFVFDFSYNKITTIPPFSALLRLFDVTGNAITNFPDSLLDARSRLVLTGNPISRTFEPLSPLLKSVETVDVAGTGIRFSTLGPSMQELITDFSGEEPDDVRRVYFEFDAAVGYAEMVGLRPTMEDGMIVRQHYRGDAGLYGIFDGHSGHKTARYAASAFPALFADKELTPAAVTEVVNQFQDTLISIGEPSGATMELLFLWDTHALISHVGDGKVAVFDRRGNVTFETEEHSPKLRREFERLRASKITMKNLRTGGHIAMSRSLGDIALPGLSHTPDFHELRLGADDRWIVIGCDGLWDDMDAAATGRALLRSKSPMEAARLLRNQAFSRGSEDNISVVVIDRLRNR